MKPLRRRSPSHLLLCSRSCSRSPSTVLATRGAVALLAGAAVGCAREPEERLCPELAAGALVVSELRVAAAGKGGEASWLELFNASAQEVDLQGLGVRLLRLDGGAEQRLLIRRSLPLAAGAQLVLSQALDDARPPYAAYGFAIDAPGPFYAAAAVTVESCEQPVDRMTYAQLPAAASYALGSWPPVADGPEGNDAAAAWCADAGRAGAAMTPGTPGERNRPCR